MLKKEIAVDKAYRLINHGPVILVSTRSKEGRYNIAPVAWNCPVKKSPTTLLAAIGRGHQTYENLKDTEEFIVCIPSAAQADMVRNTGAVSGRDTDKFKEFKIDAFPGSSVDCLVPEGSAGFIECKFKKEYDAGVALIIGEAVKAYGNEKSFTDRICPENPEGRTLHHLGGGEFSVDGESIV